MTGLLVRMHTWCFVFHLSASSNCQMRIKTCSSLRAFPVTLNELMFYVIK